MGDVLEFRRKSDPADAERDVRRAVTTLARVEAVRVDVAVLDVMLTAFGETLERLPATAKRELEAARCAILADLKAAQRMLSDISAAFSGGEAAAEPPGDVGGVGAAISSSAIAMDRSVPVVKPQAVPEGVTASRVTPELAAAAKRRQKRSKSPGFAET